MKHSSQAATTAAQSAGNKRGSNCMSAQPTAGNERGSTWIQTQFGNEYKYYLRNGCVYAANLFASGALLQTFLSAKGLSGAQIGTVTAALSMAQTVTILLFSTVVDKVRNSLRTSAKLMLLLPLFSLVMLPFSLMEGISADVLMAAVLIAGAVQNIFYELYVILDYRIPYEIIDMRHYGRLNSINGLTGGLLMVAVSGLTTTLLYRFDVGPVFFGMYLFAAACMVTGMLVTRSMRAVAKPAEESTLKRAGLMNTLRMPAFWALIAPNLMRGFNSGVVGMLATIAMFELKLSAAQTSALSIIYTAMTIAGPICFLRLQGRMRLHSMYLMASAIMLCALPTMMAGRSFGMFICVYIVLLVGLGIADYTMPVLITRVIPYESIGSYTSLRMGVHMAGLALGSMAAGAALGSIPTAALLLFSGCMQLGSGLIYWLYCRKKKDELL